MGKWVFLLVLPSLLIGACAQRGQPAEGAAAAAQRGASAAGPSAPPAGAPAAPGTEPGPRPTQAPTSETTTPPARPAPRSPGEVVPSREITLQAAAAPSAGDPPGAPSVPAARLRPLEGPAVLPEDFRIGPLGDQLLLGRAEHRVLTAAMSFLDGLAAGRLEEEVLLPEDRQELARSLQYYLDLGLRPKRFRLGTVYFDRPASAPASESSPGNQPAAEAAWLNIRLFGAPGVAEGELYLAASGGRWYVSDIQTGFALLAEPYVGRTEKYIPSAYGWRLQ